MKIFISQRVSGEDFSKLKKECSEITSILKKSGNNTYCTIINEDNSFQNKTKIEMMKYAFKKIDGSDVLLVIIRSEEKSEGMLMEIVYALGQKKKIILFIKKDIKNTYTREVANKVVEFDNTNDVYNKLKEVEF